MATDGAAWAMLSLIEKRGRAGDCIPAAAAASGDRDVAGYLGHNIFKEIYCLRQDAALPKV